MALVQGDGDETRSLKLYFLYFNSQSLLNLVELSWSQFSKIHIQFQNQKEKYRRRGRTFSITRLEAFSRRSRAMLVKYNVPKKPDTRELYCFRKLLFF